MFKNLFQSRNVLFLQFNLSARKYKSRFSKFFEYFSRESKETLLQSNEIQINSKQLAPKTITIRDIFVKSYDMKKRNKCQGKSKNDTEKSKCENKENEKQLNTKDNKNEDNKCLNENPCKGKKNLVAVLYKEHDLKLEERKRPTPRPGEILIAMDCVGLCSTDLNYFMKGKLPTPLVLGRDGTGIVTEIGEGVNNFCAGDRIVIQPNVHCGKCEFCKQCQYHLCSRTKSCGLVPYDGLLACYCTHAAENCYKLPDCVTMEEGALISMLANGINVSCRCSVCIGSAVLIIGAGPVGLTSLIAVKAMGATNTCIVCKFQDRLKVAKIYNTKTATIPENATPEDVAHMVREELGCVPSITIDSVGSENSMKLGVASTASGGLIILASVTDEEHKIPLHEIAHRDITIRSALKHANLFPAAISLANSGSINLKPLISHHFYFEEVSDAVNTLMENQKTANKVIIHIQPRDSNNKIPF